MKVKVINKTALKGKGIVDVGTVLTESDANKIELTRLVAYKKAVVIDDKNPESKMDNSNQSPKLSAGLTTKTAGAIK